MQCEPPFEEHLSQAKNVQLSFERSTSVFARHGVQLWLKLGKKPRTDACLAVARFLQALYETKDPLVENVTVDNSSPDLVRIVHHLPEESVPRLTEFMQRRQIPFEWKPTKIENTLKLTSPKEHQLGLVLGAAAVGAVGATLLQASRGREQQKRMEDTAILQEVELARAAEASETSAGACKELIEELRTTNERLQQELSETQSARRECEEAKKQLEVFRSQSAEQTKTLATCEVQNNSCIRENVHYQRELKQIKLGWEETKLAKEAAELRMRDMQQTLEGHQKEVDQAAEIQKGLELELSKLRADLYRTSERVIGPSHENLTLRKQVTTLTNKLKETTDKLLKGNTECENCEHRLEILTTQQARLKGEAKHSKEALAAVTKEMQTLNKNKVVAVKDITLIDHIIRLGVSDQLKAIHNERATAFQRLVQLKTIWTGQVDNAAKKIFTPKPPKGVEVFYSQMMGKLDDFVTESGKIMQGIIPKSIDESVRNAHAAYLATQTAAREYVVTQLLENTNLKESRTAWAWKQKMEAWMKSVDALVKNPSAREAGLLTQDDAYPGPLELPYPDPYPDLLQPFKLSMLDSPRELLTLQLTKFANEATNIKIGDQEQSNFTELKLAIVKKQDEAKTHPTDVNILITLQEYQIVQTVWIYFDMIFHEWNIPAFLHLRKNEAPAA